jgi:hypothetical protein
MAKRMKVHSSCWMLVFGLPLVCWWRRVMMTLEVLFLRLLGPMFLGKSFVVYLGLHSSSCSFGGLAHDGLWPLRVHHNETARCVCKQNEVKQP